MSEHRVKLTKRIVDDLKAGPKERFLWDNEVLGFGLRISLAGTITYILQYRFEGRQRRFKIGLHGSPWTPETARQEARSLQGKIVDGTDPQQIRISDRKELTISELGEIYLTETLVTAKETSVKAARNNVDNHIKPLLGSRRAATLTRVDVEQLMRDVAAGKTARKAKTGYRKLSRVRGGKGAASQCLTTLSAMMGVAVVRGMRLDNPVIGVRRFPGKKMERFLSPVELARRIFCGGDAVHRHPPSSGLGLNTCVQDGHNLGWKLAYVARGIAGAALLQSYTEERAPVGRQIVERANQSRRDYAAMQAALKIPSAAKPSTAGRARLRDPGPEGVKARDALTKALEMKQTEFNALGVELNQRYQSSAIIPDDGAAPEVFERDKELYHQATTRPGAKIPHVWLVDHSGKKCSTLDVTGKSKFSLVTGLSGTAWVEAAARFGTNFLRCVVIDSPDAQDL